MKPLESATYQLNDGNSMRKYKCRMLTVPFLTTGCPSTTNSSSFMWYAAVSTEFSSAAYNANQPVFLQVSLSHIIRDGYYMPLAKLGERNPLFLTYILKRDLPTKVHLGKFLLSIKYGMHLDFPFCRTVPVAAVRLEAHPGVKNSCFAVDGEIVQTSRIQAAVTNFTMNVMCR